MDALVLDLFLVTLVDLIDRVDKEVDAWGDFPTEEDRDCCTICLFLGLGVFDGSILNFPPISLDNVPPNFHVNLGVTGFTSLELRSQLALLWGSVFTTAVSGGGGGGGGWDGAV
jgi:hypothetical protein